MDHILYEDEKTILVHPSECLEYLKSKSEEDPKASFIYGCFLLETDNFFPDMPETGIMYIYKSAMKNYQPAIDKINSIDKDKFRYLESMVEDIKKGISKENSYEKMEIVTKMNKIDNYEQSEKSKIISQAKEIFGKEKVKAIWLI